MSSTPAPARRTRLGWVAGILVALLVAAGVVFGLTDDSLAEGQDSALARQFTSVAEDGDPAPEPAVATTFGRLDGARTLVLYEDTGSRADEARMYAIATGNLVSHFGTVRLLPAREYRPGQAGDFDAVVYLGTDASFSVPAAVRRDVLTGTVPVLWAGQNLADLTDDAAAPGSAREFTARYGWDPRELRSVPGASVTTVRYEGRDVTRAAESSGDLSVPVLPATAAVDAASAAAGSGAETSGGGGVHVLAHAGEHPWAVRSANLTYLAEIPLDYIDENDVYLIYTDLFYDLLAPETQPVKQAAVRLEDVGPESDPRQLRAVADYLHGAGVPFQVAVMPIHVARTEPGGDQWYGLSLTDRPEVVSALKYMQQRGGTLIQHGTSHQYGASDNPYSGRTGEDYEFYRYGCSARPEPPFEFEPCRQDSSIRPVGPVGEDSVDQHAQRIRQGRQVMIDAGLGEPTIFETPHYAGSVNAYHAMSEVYGTRYEQAEYFASLLSDEHSAAGASFSQQFPFTVHDIYGATVYPENLGNITETEQNHHAVRDPDFLVARAKAHLTVRESTASFFFHPYLDLDYLKRTVQGITDLGYTFVPVTELK